jgi:hypothetical protein
VAASSRGAGRPALRSSRLQPVTRSELVKRIKFPRRRFEQIVLEAELRIRD